MKKGKVRYAVVGMGHIAQVAVLPAFKHASRNSLLGAVVSSNSDKRNFLEKKYGVRAYTYEEYDDLLKSGTIDAVYIALPNSMHCDFAVRAAEAGVHILVEKPMATTQEDCGRMIHAADSNGVKLMVGYRLHFEPANLEAVKIAKSGRLGELRFFNSVFSMQVKKGNIRVQDDLGGGSLYDLGIYCINAARYIFQDEPEEVFAYQESGEDKRFKEVDEMTTAILRFPGKRLAVFTSSFGAQAISTYQVVGAKGELRLDPAYEYVGDLVHHLTLNGKSRTKVFKAKDQFAPELIYFSNCILEDLEPEPSGKEGLADLIVIEALQHSAVTGIPVNPKPWSREKRPGPAMKIKKPPVQKPKLVEAESASGGP